MSDATEKVNTPGIVDYSGSQSGQASTEGSEGSCDHNHDSPMFVLPPKPILTVLVGLTSSDLSAVAQLIKILEDDPNHFQVISGYNKVTLETAVAFFCRVGIDEYMRRLQDRAAAMMALQEQLHG